MTHHPKGRGRIQHVPVCLGLYGDAFSPHVIKNLMQEEIVAWYSLSLEKLPRLLPVLLQQRLEAGVIVHATRVRLGIDHP